MNESFMNDPPVQMAYKKYIHRKLGPESKNNQRNLSALNKLGPRHHGGSLSRHVLFLFFITFKGNRIKVIIIYAK